MSNHIRSARFAPRLALSRKHKLAVSIVASLSLLVLTAGAAQASAPHAGESSMPGTSGSSSNGLLMDPATLILGNPVINNNSGELYGIASSGGANNLGGIFSETASQFIGDVQDFGLQQANTDAPITSQGQLNAQKILQTSIGPLYFVSYGGGAPGAGNATAHGGIYEFSKSNTPQLTTVHTFYGSAGDGANPFTVLLGGDGNLYGATAGYTSNGSTNSNSVIFELTPSGTETIIYNATDSRAPDNFLIGTTDGNFYETLSAGTVVNSSELVGDTIFRITPQGQRTLVQTLTSADGEGIVSLIEDSQGNFYGVTSGGGQYDEGTIFKYNLQSNAVTVLYSFNGENNGGINPGKLILGADGNIYGVTQNGGVSNSGTMYRLAPDGVYTTLINFSGSNGLGGGQDPVALLQGAGRSFYVATSAGGQNQSGATFDITVPITDDFFGSSKSSILAYGSGTMTTYSTINASAVTSAITQGFYPAAVGDFNGDGYADILWIDAGNDVYIWSGGANGSFTHKYYGNIGSGWQVVGAADMNDDGNDDIILNNPSQHLIQYRLMNSTTSPSSKTVSYTAGYYPVATGNFAGTGYGGIIWTSAKNDLYVWNATASGGYSSTYIGTYPAGWTVVGRGDIDGDGIDDLVWFNIKGNYWSYWLMNANGTVKGEYSAQVPAAGYHIATVADYNGDGRADILWANGQNTMLSTTQSGTCTTSAGCSFTTAPAVTIPNGQVIFNSGVPVTAPAWAN